MTGWSVRQLKNEIAQSVDAVSIRLAVRLASIATDICCRSGAAEAAAAAVVADANVSLDGSCTRLTAPTVVPVRLS